MRQETSDRHAERIGDSLRYISTNLMSSLRLEDLSRRFNMATFHFHRTFRRLTGQPVHRFIRDRRLELAAYRLLFTERSIIHIAFDSGYDSHEAFSRAFKQYSGVSPSLFRKLATPAREPYCWVAKPAAEIPDTVPLKARLSVPRSEVSEQLLPKRKVAFMSYFGPVSGLKSAWQNLAHALRRRGLQSDSMTAIGVQYDDPERHIGDSIRYDACVVVPDDFGWDESLGMQVLPAVETLAMECVAPYELGLHTYLRLLTSWAVSGWPGQLRPLPYYELFYGFPFRGGDSAIRMAIHIPVQRGLSARPL